MVLYHASHALQAENPDLHYIGTSLHVIHHLFGSSHQYHQGLDAVHFKLSRTLNELGAYLEIGLSNEQKEQLSIILMNAQKEIAYSLDGNQSHQERIEMIITALENLNSTLIDFMK